MTSAAIMNDIQFSAILPERLADIHHEHVNGAHVYSFQDQDGTTIRAVSESGGVFVVMTGDILLS